MLFIILFCKNDAFTFTKIMAAIKDYPHFYKMVDPLYIFFSLVIYTVTCHCKNPIKNNIIEALTDNETTKWNVKNYLYKRKKAMQKYLSNWQNPQTRQAQKLPEFYERKTLRLIRHNFHISVPKMQWIKGSHSPATFIGENV